MWDKTQFENGSRHIHGSLPVIVKTKMNRKYITELILPIFIILVNLFFLPLSFQIIVTGGGPMGFGVLILPITILVNLLLIPAIVAIRKRKES